MANGQWSCMMSMTIKFSIFRDRRCSYSLAKCEHDCGIPFSRGWGDCSDCLQFLSLYVVGPGDIILSHRDLVSICHCYRRSLTPVSNLLKDKRQQLLVRPFDKEDISFHLITFIYRACSTPWRFRVNQPGVGSRTWCPQLAWGEICLCLKKKKIFHLWHQFRVPNICSSLYLGLLFAGTKCWFVRSKKPGEIPELRHCTSTTGNTRHTKLATLSSLWQNFFTIFTTTIIRW